MVARIGLQKILSWVKWQRGKGHQWAEAIVFGDVVTRCSLCGRRWSLIVGGGETQQGARLGSPSNKKKNKYRFLLISHPATEQRSTRKVYVISLITGSPLLALSSLDISSCIGADTTLTHITNCRCTQASPPRWSSTSLWWVWTVSTRDQWWATKWFCNRFLRTNMFSFSILEIFNLVFKMQESYLKPSWFEIQLFLLLKYFQIFFWKNITFLTIIILLDVS